MICVTNLQSPDDITLFNKQRFGNLGHSRAPVREKGGERAKNFRVQESLEAEKDIKSKQEISVSNWDPRSLVFNARKKIK